MSAREGALGLESWDRLPLYASWGGPSKGMLRRFLGRRERLFEVGALVRQGTRVILEMGPHGSQSEVDLSEPVQVHVSHVLGGDVARVSVVVRQGPLGSGIAFQALLPASVFGSDLPIKEERSPLLAPRDFLRVYGALRQHALITGSQSPPEVLEEPSAEQLAQLRSTESTLVRCEHCRSPSVELQAEDAYFCTDCGREGGPGWGQVQVMERERFLAALHSDERWVVGLQSLRRAQEQSGQLAADFKVFALAPSPEIALQAHLELVTIRQLMERAQQGFAEHADSIQAIQETTYLPPLLGGLDPQSGGAERDTARHTVVMREAARHLIGVIESVESSDSALSPDAARAAHLRVCNRYLAAILATRHAATRKAHVQALEWHVAHVDHPELEASMSDIRSRLEALRSYVGKSASQIEGAELRARVERLMALLTP